MRINNDPIITNGSMAATLTSDQVRVDHVVYFSIQVTWSGTSPVGTLTLQASNDGTTWDTIPNSSQSLSGNTGSHTWNYQGSGFQRVRAVYTRTSGTGTMQMRSHVKGV